MKKFKLFKLSLLLLLVISSTHAWAWYYVPSNFPPGANWSNTANRMNSGNNLTFHAVPAGTYYFRIYKDGWTNPTGADRFAADPRGGAISANGTNGDGAMWITTTEVADIKFQIKYDEDAKDWSDRVYVEAQTATYYIRYNWNNSGWVWSSAMSSNGDGTYACVGTYRGTNGTDYQHSKCNSEYVEGTSGTATIIGTTPSQGENCVFTLKISDNSLTIRKCNSITPTNYIFFDNSASSLTRDHKYFVIGRPVSASNATSKTYELTEVENTKLWLHTSTTDTWTDANYFAVLGSDTYFSNGDWYHLNIQTASEYSAPHLTHYNMEDGHNYIVYKADDSNGSPISVNENGTTASAMNTTQTIKFSISRDGRSTYAEQTSGVTPAQITISAYKFVNGTYNSVTNTDNSSSISVNQTSTYSTSVDAAYTGATSLSYTSQRDGYTFVGWFDAASGGSAVSSPCYPRETGTIYARFWAHRYTIAFNANDAQYSDAPAATGSTASNTNVVYDQDQTLTTNGFSRAGYSFAGWATTPTGDVVYADKASVKNLVSTDGTTVTLYAKWTPKALTFSATSGSNWSTAANWTESCVPTIAHDITISAPVTVNTNAAVAKSIAFSGTGKITIPSDGVLEVAGTIDNGIADNIVINSTSSSQGALICNLSSAPAATVNMTLPSGGFHLIASPTGGARVSSTFSGTGIYTWAWEEGKGWDRRGYYEDFTGGEPILLYGQTSCSFSGYLANYCGGSLAYTSTPETEDAKGINMLSNSLTAPILISKMSLSGSYDDNVYLLENGVWKGYYTKGEGTDVIPALNGYGVVAESSGSVSVDYATAVRGASNKNAALKAPERTSAEDQDYINITVTTNEREIDLRLYEDAAKFTDAVDKGYEACYIEGDGRFGQLYAYAERKMTKLAKANLEGTVLGFAPGETESYTISFEGDGRGYYLNDVATGESTLIDEDNTYNFKSDENTNATRFVVSKMPMKPTGVDEVADGSKARARKQMIDGTLYIIRDGRIYDATGSLVK